MSSKTEEHRYLFTVRQEFGKTPRVDCFYELTMPSGITSDQAEVMTILKEDWCQEEMANDTHVYRMMQMRLRFNSDCFQSVCMVRSTIPLTDEMLNEHIKVKHNEGELEKFLKAARV